MTSLLLFGLASGTALADDPADPDDLYPVNATLYPQDPRIASMGSSTVT